MSQFLLLFSYNYLYFAIVIKVLNQSPISLNTVYMLKKLFLFLFFLRNSDYEVLGFYSSGIHFDPYFQYLIYSLN